MLANLQKPRPRLLDRRALKLEAERQLKQARAFVKTRDGGTCRSCKKPGNQAHHVIYRSHGGTDDPSNLVWCCTMCHQEIHARVLIATFDPRHPAKSVKFTRNCQWD